MHAQQTLIHCKGRAAEILAMSVGYIIAMNPNFVTALRAHTAALVAAAQPGLNLFTAKTAARCLAMIGGQAAATEQRQPLLLHVSELLALMQLRDDQYTLAAELNGVDELSHQLPSPAASAGTAVEALLSNSRGVAALLQEHHLDALFAAVQVWAPGTSAAASILSALVRRKMTTNSTFLAAPERLAVLHGLQQRMPLIHQLGLQHNPAGFAMLGAVCSMTEVASQCQVAPAYIGLLSEAAWQIPAYTSAAFSALQSLLWRRVGLLQMAPMCTMWHVLWQITLTDIRPLGQRALYRMY